MKDIADYLHILKNIDLFENFTNKDILSSLSCLQANINNYYKDEAIFLAGEKVTNIGIILSGTLQIQKEDINGNTNIITNLESKEIFAEAYVCANVETPISVWTKTNSKVLFINYSKLINICSNQCPHHSLLIKNMLKIMSRKLIAFNQKISILQKATIREKLLAYFEICIENAGSNSFTLPFNRNALAEYIGVNRSALSRELSNMRKDKILTYNGNQIIIF